MAFVDNFWELEFTGTQGFEVLVRRLKEGKRMGQDVEDFLKQRAKIEESYAKELLKLAKNAGGTTELGTLRASWDALKSETEAVGRERQAMSQRLTAELEKAVKEFKDKQRESRKRTEDTVKRAQAFKKTAYGNENRARTDYQNKCRTADKNEDTASKSGHLPPKKLEELRQRAKRSRQQAEQLDLAYQESIKNLDEARVLWEREMEICCRTFQELEEERISFTRNILWKFTNVCSSVAVQEDEMHEHVRNVLERCDIDSDIQQFVQQRRTGKERPVPIEYENFYGQNPPMSIRPSAQQQKHSRSNDPLPATPSHTDSRQAPMPTVDEAAYTTVGEAMGSSHGPEGAEESIGRVRALYDYDAQGEEELTFREGDVIHVLVKEDENWWLGHLHGRRGMFPCSYVENLP